MTGSLPRRYARALIGIATEENQVGPFGEGLENLTYCFQQAPEMLAALANDSFETSKRLAVMEEVSKKAGLPELLKRFLLLLIQKNRIGLLPEIAREYRRFHDEILGIVRVAVATPRAPEPLLLKRIEKILSERLKKQVMAQGEAKPEMIGGLILKIDHTIYDGSVRRELERIKETMLKGTM